MSYNFQRYERELAEANNLNKAAVFDALTTAGITEIIVAFDGSGDQGQIESVTAYAGETVVECVVTLLAIYKASHDETKPLTAVDRPLPEAIEELCYGFLDQEYSGWENNDGAYGEFRFDIATRTIHFEINQRYTDIETEEHTF
jgi:hypothetical protein